MVPRLVLLSAGSTPRAVLCAIHGHKAWPSPGADLRLSARILLFCRFFPAPVPTVPRRPRPVAAHESLTRGPTSGDGSAIGPQHL